MAAALTADGYRVCNIDYPSRKHRIAELAAEYVLPAIKACSPNPNVALNFVTHSLGGILVRQLAATQAIPVFGRVVMLGPPNHGSEVVDALGALPPFRWINGPAGNQLGTTADSIPKQLGSAPFPVGIIAGRRSINLILSMFIAGQNDGKVSVESAKLEGMRDFLVLPVAHPFLMRDHEAIRQTLVFLDTGAFDHGADSKR